MTNDAYDMEDLKDMWNSLSSRRKSQIKEGFPQEMHYLQYYNLSMDL